SFTAAAEKSRQEENGQSGFGQKRTEPHRALDWLLYSVGDRPRRIDRVGFLFVHGQSHAQGSLPRRESGAQRSRIRKSRKNRGQRPTSRSGSIDARLLQQKPTRS